MKKFYPAKYILSFVFFALIMTELSAQRARKRHAKKTYVCGLAYMKFSDSNVVVDQPIKVESKADANSRLVVGCVKDLKGNPIPFPTVMLKGTVVGVAGDENGNFTLNARNQLLDELIISAVGFKTTSHKIRLSNPEIISKIDIIDTVFTPTEVGSRNCVPIEEIQLELKEDVMEGIAIAAPYGIIRRRHETYCNSKIIACGYYIKKDAGDNNNNSFSVYPNPIRSGRELKVDWKVEAGEYNWELVDVAGRVVKTGRSNIIKTQTITIQIPPAPTGSYVLNFYDNKGKRYSEKIIITQ